MNNYCHKVYRHGDRSPIKTYPTDPYGESIWPQGFSQLTNAGKRQHFELGKFLRSRYIDGKPYRLLNSSYNRYETEIRSTDTDRTLMSAYSNLAGLYPPADGQIWNDELAWQPIPVHTVQNSLDYLLNMEVDCPSYERIYQGVMHGDEVQQIMTKYKNFFDFVKEKSGKQDVDMSNLWEISDALRCQNIHNFTIPSWAHEKVDGEDVFETMMFLNGPSFALQYNRDDEARLKGGALVGRSVGWLLKLTAPIFKFIIIYSLIKHDDTLAALMGTMNIYDELTPPYASCLLVEIFKKNENKNKSNQYDDYYVKVSYRNDTSVDPYILKLPECPVNCPLLQFIKVTKKNVPDDWKAECIKSKIPVICSFFLFLHFVYLFLHFIYLFIHNVIHSFIRSFIHSLIYFCLFVESVMFQSIE
ncbi:hypothetical protein HELRODRAFT_84756 [Helobdella robusta]|uniref:acid phosphatase n=1 Tax=Helobdella robusta TaxID=6412 RepID=T1G5N3_HELRO|nr:hypothetical protein HELRODRAFT_84756 [Helobdella robusta]ESN98287.1 hypothetical protein HELRODRAFT_84756 [Helobdella robusta]